MFLLGEIFMPLRPSDQETLAKFAVVIITGASSGIGRCLGQTMAAVKPGGMFLSVSRSAPPAFVTSLKHASLDLSKQDGVEAASAFLLTEILQEPTKGPILLINNSGFGAYGLFPSPDRARQESMIALNAIAPVALTAHLLPVLRERGGAILNVASVAGFLPTPFLATYGATKAFLLHWSLALAEELRPDGITVTALCPGPTRTKFFSAAGFTEPPATGYSSQTAESVAEEALRGLARGHRVVVTGLRNRFVFGFAQLWPRSWIAWLSGQVLRRLRLERFQGK